MNATGSGPSVSVVLPVFNGASFLAGALASVRAQTHPPTQIIVVDDGSSDDTARVAQTLGADVEFIAQENRGPAAARNRGLELARGDFVSFLDVDDLWPEDKLAGQLEYFAQQPGAAVVLGQTRILLEQGGETPLRPAAAHAPDLPHLYLIGAALFRRAVFAQIGVFDPAKRYGEDLDWFLRARENQVRLHLLPRLALIKRCHADNMTRGKSLAEIGLTAALHASLARRRKTGGVAKPLQELRP